MLNELYSLSKALDDMGIKAQEWYREYNVLPKVTAKSPCIRLWLGRDGSIRGFDTLTPEQARAIRKYGNKQNSFPAFNIVPLYRVTGEEQIKVIARVREKPMELSLANLRAYCANDNWTGKSEQISRCLNKSAADLLHCLEGAGCPPDNIVSKLIGIADSYADAAAFRQAIEACVFTYLEQKREVATALGMLFHIGKEDATDPQKDCGSLSVVLDYSEWQEYGNPIASETTTQWINQQLIIYDRAQKESAAINGVDAFGAPYGKIDEPMPNVSVNGFGMSGLTLRSMFREQHCQERYGTFDSKSYPIAAGNRADTKKALEWIADDGNRDVTWVKAESNEIVFAYTFKMTHGLNPASILMGQREPGAEAVEMRFLKRLEDFSRVFRSLPPQNIPKHIRIFSIRKMDKARSKVVYTRNCDPKRFIECAEVWRQGCQNLPAMPFGEIETPFPLDFYRIANTVWKRNGESAAGKEKVKRIKYYEGMNLLLDEPSEPNILHYLNVLLNNWAGLFAYAGNNLTTHKNNYIPRAELNQSLAVIALLLYKGGYKKEDYMENTAYLVGQLLKVSDDLHAMYCKVVREGDVPPQLAGNSVFIAASDTPVRALAQLSLRMCPYIAWAEQYRTKGINYDDNDPKMKGNKDKESWRAHWFLNLYNNIATRLQPLLSDGTRFGEFEKAQLFLGYLASYPKREEVYNGAAIGQ